MQNLKINTNICLLILVGMVIGSRVEILMQQWNWTPAICVARVIEADEIAEMQDDGTTKSIKTGNSKSAVAVK